MIAFALFWGTNCADGSKTRNGESRALMKKARDLAKVRRYQDARATIETACRLSPGSYEIQRDYVKLLMREGGEAARSYVSALLEKSPEESLPYLLMSQVEEERGNKEKWIDDALALDPASAWALIERARLALAADDHEGAIRILQKALSSPDAMAEAGLLLADAYEGAGRTEEAARTLDQLFHSHPDEEVRSEASGELFFLLWEHDRQEALSLADTLRASSHDPFLLADIGASLADVPDHRARSIGFFEKAITESDTLTMRRLYPEASAAWLEERAAKNRGFFGESMGGAYVELGRHEEAVRVLENAKADLGDPTKELLFFLARAYEKTGREDEAIDALIELLSAQIDRTAGSLLDSLYSERHGSLDGLSERIEEARRTFSKTAPGFTIAKDGGGEFSLEDLRGKVVLIAFWFPT